MSSPQIQQGEEPQPQSPRMEAKKSTFSKPQILALATFLAVFQFISPSTGGKSLIQYLLVGRDLNAVETSSDLTDTNALGTPAPSFSPQPKHALTHPEPTSNRLQQQTTYQRPKYNFSYNPNGNNRTIPIFRNPSYNFSTAICSMVKDGEAYFEEWLDYHLLALEFDNIYLYDNSENFDLKRWYQHSNHHPVYHRVEIIHDPTKDQAGIMAKCIQRYGKNPNGPHHDYIALIDVDEFLVITDYPNSYTNIHGILQDYLVPYGGALSVNWMLVGTANRSVYAPLPVTKRFQYRDANASAVIKSIVKSTDFVKLRNPHSVRLQNNKLKTHTTKEPGHEIHCTSHRCAIDYNRPSHVFLLYHFRYTSEKEYLYKKCARGRPNLAESWCNPNGTLRADTPGHIQLRAGTVLDDKPWQILTSKVPKYKMYDQFEDLH